MDSVKLPSGWVYCKFTSLFLVSYKVKTMKISVRKLLRFDQMSNHHKIFRGIS